MAIRTEFLIPLEQNSWNLAWNFHFKMGKNRTHLYEIHLNLFLNHYRKFMLKSAIFLDFYKINRGVSGLWPFVLTLTKHILLSSLFHYINLVSYFATVVGESGSETKKEKKQILIVPSTFALKLFRVKIAMFVLTKNSKYWLIQAYFTEIFCHDLGISEFI